MPNTNLNHPNGLTEREEQALKTILHTCSDLSYNIEQANHNILLDVMLCSLGQDQSQTELIKEVVQLFYFIGHYSSEINSIHDKLKNNQLNTESN